MLTRPILALLLLTTPAFADPVTLSGSYSVVSPVLCCPYVPPPRTIHWNELAIPNVFPSPNSQLFTLPLETVPDTVLYGLGNYRPGGAAPPRDTYASLGTNKRVLGFVPDRLELELAYWFHTPMGGAHSLEWRIVGDGTIVPEPGAMAILMGLGAVLRVRRRATWT